MYRLCRFFISDVTAGENLLQNGFVPILRESGNADHGVLFAANGTCKTTVLSFILNVFCPDQRRFVQHLQSGGDKTLDQYLIPGRPAVVLLDLVNLRQSTLFEVEPQEHLVIGQFLYRHRSATDKVDRIYFMAQSVDFFDRLRSHWSDLMDREQPWRSVRDFAAGHIQQTTSQKEWADSLERLGLDPWLMERQIDFARSEGGIKDAFKFRSEEEFLNFFLGCVTDMEAAATLRDTIAQSLRKMEDRPRKIAQLGAARDLKERIADFDQKARRWREARQAIEASRATLGEAAHLMAEAEKAASRKLDILTPSLDEAQHQSREALSKLEMARANELTVERWLLRRQITTAEAEIKAAEDRIQGGRDEENALKAADVLAKWRRGRAEAQIKRDALLQANEELSPFLHRIDVVALQYHARLDEERRRLTETIKERETRLATLSASAKATIEERAELKNQRETLAEKIQEHHTRIQTAEEQRAALPLQPGETPADVRERLGGEIGAMEDRITATRGRQAALEEEMRTGDAHWRKLTREQSGVEVRLDRARRRLQDEDRQRERLLTSNHLRRVAGNTDFEPTSAELVSRLDDAVARSRSRLEDDERRRVVQTMALERLAGNRSLAVDDQTRDLIAHFHAQGISAGELKAFPEYLAGLYPSPEVLAPIIQGDPGRFTGIMAATEEVIEAVLALPVPEWLQRPVVISTPGAPEALAPIDEAVISPPNPEVYSPQHLEKTRLRLTARLEDLTAKIREQAAELREMETESRALRAYREQYADAAAVTALSDRVAQLDQRLTSLSAQIAAHAQQADSLRDRKTELETTRQTLAVRMTRLEERHGQVKHWLNRYAPLETWQREVEEMIAEKEALNARIKTNREALVAVEVKITGLRVEIGEGAILLKGLDERAADVLKPEEATLSNAEWEAALDLDLRSLRRLHDEARERQRHKADALGIEALNRDLESLTTRIAEDEARLTALCREHPHDEDLADRWAASSDTDREGRRSALADVIAEKSAFIGNRKSSIGYRTREIERLKADLAEMAGKGIRPDIQETELTDQDPEGLIHRLQREQLRHDETFQRLKQRCQELKSAIEVHRKWYHETQLGLAETRTFSPLWDQHSPRSDWPDLLGADSVEENIQAVGAMRDAVRERMATWKEEEQAVEAARSRMSNGFDRLQADLQGENLRSHLPAVIDELRRHDPESLGAQADDLIQRCGDIARNIESDLEISQRIMDNLVEMLLSRAKEYHQKVQAAAREMLPKEVFIYGGRSILRAGTRLDFVRYGEDFKRSVENWLHELIQHDRLPEVNQRAGNCLGAELLYQLLGASTGKKVFGIRLLKCDDTGRNYEPVGKDLGSGGEALTTAVLLYTLLISMRKKRHNQPDRRIPAFLVLNNPLGVCNRSDFLDAQLKVARAMGIQCVYLTGINDRESLDLFDLKVAIRKVDKKLEIDQWTYDLLEIT